MKKISIAVCAVLMAGAAMAQDKTPAAAPAGKAPAIKAQADNSGMTEDQKTLYFLGKAVSSRIKQFDFSPEEAKYVEMGFTESLEGKGDKVDDSYGAKLNEFLGKKQEAAVAKTKEEARPFLEKMAKEHNAVVLSSGIIYIPIKKGNGASPKATDMVKVDYTGTLPDGKVFDSSIQRGTPAEFPLNGVIPCWTTGVQHMKVGGEAKLVCPSDTAYGDQGAGATIPGGATLVFEVHLLEIMKQPSAAAAKPVRPHTAVKTAPAGKTASGK
jgi:FKBP-type peptidyl-prolyl cis-trans isomerase FkpA